MPVSQSNYVTKSELRSELSHLEERMTKRIIDDLSQVIDAMGQRMHDELIAVRQEMSDIRKSLNDLTNTVDGFVKRLDDVEVENTARDAQFQRLLAWAEKVSSKTGIPLEY